MENWTIYAIILEAVYGLVLSSGVDKYVGIVYNVVSHMQ